MSADETESHFPARIAQIRTSSPNRESHPGLKRQVRSTRSYFFRIANRLICLTFSKDLDFDENEKYKIDCNKGEIYVYPAFIDEVGLLGS
jgi:hypothetical protein